MTTVYAFHRIEPISRQGDPGRGLAAPVHDPLWLLARQREFGELAGEDAGSPVHVQFRLRTDPIDGWSPQDAAGGPRSYDSRSQILEAVVAGESPAPAHSRRDHLDAGRRLATMVGEPLGTALRAAFPLPAGDDTTDRVAVRAAGRFADGLAVAAAVMANAGAADTDLAGALGAAVGDVTPARVALQTFADWCVTTFGIGPASWIPERLERRFRLTVAGTDALTAPAHTRAVVDAPDLELTAASGSLAMPDPGLDQTLRIPTVLRFPGMPNDRFWEFEDAQLALHRIDAATHDLARLALVEFSSVYGNDWFTFPVPIGYGTVATLPELVVRDTFGVDELITQASDPAWSMFEPTRPGGVAARLVVPAVTVAALTGPIVEEVAFVRDENANLVWALERIVTDPGGRTHDLVAEWTAAATSAPQLPTDAELLYRLMTDVPEHWVPFIPVQVDQGHRAVGLVQAVLPRPNSWGELVEVAPRSSVLQELRGVVLHEEEVPSDGVVVRRQWYLARSADGGRHVWTARTASTGRGEGSSGLAYDITIDVRAR